MRRALNFALPVTDSTIVTDTINEVAKEFGRLDIFVSHRQRVGLTVALLTQIRCRLLMPGWYGDVLGCCYRKASKSSFSL